MGLFGIARRVGTRVSSSLGTSTGRAAAGGAAAGGAGGLLLDDVPILGQLDPTEGGGQGNSPLGSINPNLILLAVIALGFAWVMGGGN